VPPVPGNRRESVKLSQARELHLEGRIRELESEVGDLHAELERSERRVEAIRQIGHVLGSNLELQPLLAEIVDRTTELLDADRTTLFLVDADQQELWSKVLQGPDIKEIRFPVGVGIAGWVAEKRKPLHIRDAYTDRRFNPEFDKRSGYKTRNMLVWPVKRPQGTDLLGVVQVLNKNQGAFRATDERLLEAIASEIGVALEVSNLYRRAVERTKMLERTRRELMLLFETERAISQSDDLEGMLNSILDTAMKSLNARTAAIHVLDDRGYRVVVLAARGVGAKSIKTESVALGEGIVGNVVKSGERVVLNDIEGLKRGRTKAKRVLAVAIRTRYAGNIGAFELVNRPGKDGFTDADATTLQVVAAQAGRAIDAERRRRDRVQSERLTTIGRMLSGVIHDLRTPMTLISGYTQVMAEASDPGARTQYAHLVNKQIDLLSAMTRDLLAFARGERSLLLRKVYLQRFMEEMREYLQQELEGTDIELKLNIKFRGAARFDETKIRRVFHNICRNAREAMPGGGRLTISVLKEDEDLLLEFVDNGSGIPMELRHSLFEPFATAGKVGGTGLGLAMVKQIAEEHRGTVVFEDGPKKKGTLFRVRLPLQP
jgi:signal transduction histidine kinase